GDCEQHPTPVAFHDHTPPDWPSRGYHGRLKQTSTPSKRRSRLPITSVIARLPTRVPGIPSMTRGALGSLPIDRRAWKSHLASNKPEKNLSAAPKAAVARFTLSLPPLTNVAAYPSRVMNISQAMSAT